MTTSKRQPSRWGLLSPTTLRALTPTDRDTLPEITRATGAFSEEEVGIVRELVDHALDIGDERFRFVIAELAPRTVGFACWGLGEQSDGVHLLYWIAVDPDHQGRGVGQALLAFVESEVGAARGRSLVAETEGSPAYLASRAFYLTAGYAELGRIPHYYRLGSDKVLYGKSLGAPASEVALTR